jgi:hypothetical protein
MKETWRDIVNYEGIYKISNKGNVKSLARFRRNGINGKYKQKERILKPGQYSNDYYFVYLCDNSKKKSCSIHRLIALAFIPNPLNKPHINHINGIRTDNKIENLEWCTRSENQLHAIKIGTKNDYGSKSNFSKLRESDVLEIRRLKKMLLKSNKELAKNYKVTVSNIEYIIARKSWKHI